MTRLFTSVRIALLIGLAFAVLRWQNPQFLQLLDARAMDYRMRLRERIEPTGQVVIVAVDNKSVAEIGRWVWPRSILAQLFEKIDAAEPRAVGVDIVFSETSDFQEQGGLSARPHSVSGDDWEAVQEALRAQDAALAEVIRESGHIVLGYILDQDESNSASPAHLSAYNLYSESPGQQGEKKIPRALGAATNLPEYQKGARATGYFNVVPDADGSVRRAPLVMSYENHMLVPLALSTLRTAAGKLPLAVKFDGAGVKEIKFGPLPIPVDETGKLLINYRGPAQTFPHISAVDVLRGEVPEEMLRGKIVIVGVTAVGVYDFRVTPFDVFPGVEIHANVIDNILKGDFLHQPLILVVVEIACILAFAMILGVAMMRARGVAAAIVASVLLLAYTVGSQLVFVYQGIPLSLFYPLLSVSLTYAAIALLHYMTEARERKKLRSALDVYLSPSMAELLSKQPERLGLGGEKLDLTVFFSDIRGFTTISERLSPEVLVELLNEYLGDMTEIVFEYDGMLDKYIGDAVMAVWGAPLPQADHARRACMATLDMVTRLDVLNERWTARGLEPLAIGCGLNTGPMSFGNMGSTQHMAITVMGDNVNLGSRLEGLTKTYGAKIIAAESTIREADGAVVARELDLVRVKGKGDAVRIFELLGRGEDAATWKDLLDEFAKGLQLYRERHWEDALAVFNNIVEKRPDDGPAQLFVTRCRRLLVEPPEDWDPVTKMESK